MAKDVVILDLNQTELALRIAEAITGTMVRQRYSVEAAMNEMHEQAEDLWHMTMDAAQAALEYFNERLQTLNEQTQRLSGEDMVRSMSVFRGETQH